MNLLNYNFNPNFIISSINKEINMNKLFYKPIVCIIPIQDDRLTRFFSILENGAVTLPIYNGESDDKIKTHISNNIQEDYNLFIPQENWSVLKETRDYIFIVSNKKITSDNKDLFSKNNQKTPIMLAGEHNTFNCKAIADFINKIKL